MVIMKYGVRGIKIWISIILVIGFVLMPVTFAQAVTVYQSVDMEFEEKYSEKRNDNLVVIR